MAAPPLHVVAHYGMLLLNGLITSRTLMNKNFGLQITIFTLSGELYDNKTLKL
jgi:hypothetical protein